MITLAYNGWRLINYFKMVNKKSKIVIHVCCAACASQVMRELSSSHEIIFFFFNPNLNEENYQLHYDGVLELSKINDLLLTVPNNQRAEYLKLIEPFRDPSSIKYINDKGRLERKCREILISLIMERTAEMARKNRYKAITTSMLCSPYRDHNTIWDIGTRVTSDYQLGFIYRDFRKGYWMGRNYTRKFNLSVPVYCSDYLE